MKRRGFLALSAAAGVARFVPVVAKERRILTLVYDKVLGGLRAVERVVR